MLAITHLFFKFSNNQLDSTIVLWKDQIEFMFIVLMSGLLIYSFNPRSKIVVTSEMRLLLFLFGIVLLITAEWRKFFNVLSSMSTRTTTRLNIMDSSDH